MNDKQSKKLSKRQLKVLDDLLSGQMDEAAILKKHKVSIPIFRNWLSRDIFIEELRFRIEASRRQSEIIISKVAPIAAAKLVELTESEKEETARKACLDIISLPVGSKTVSPEKMPIGEDAIAGDFSPDLASRLLKALAEENDISS